MEFVGFARDYRTKARLATFVIVLSFVCLLSSIGVHAQMNGFRVESCDETAASDTAGRVSIVGGRDVNIRVFTVEQLKTNTQISFTTVVADRNTKCDDLRSTSIFNLAVDVSGSESVNQSSSARAVIRLPADRAVYMFCLRHWSIWNTSSNWLHQGNSSWLQLAVTGPVAPTKSWLPLWASIVIIAVLVAVSALCTALGIETLSLSRSELKMLRSCGVSDERRFAKAVGPFRKRGNRVLCGLLFSSLFANAGVAVLIEDLMQLPGAAMLVAAAIIMLFGALLPMIASSKVGLLIAAKSSWLVNIFVVIAFPFSFPFGRLMDWFLADDLPCVCNRNRLQCIQQSTQTSTVIKEEEKDETKTGGSRSLGLSDKCVRDLMTKIEDVFMVEYNGILDKNTLEQILSSGYTRIPVYEKDITNIVALLHVRDLTYVSASDRTSLRTLCKFYNHPVNFVFEDTKLEVMLEEFKKGQSHMAFVQRVNCEGTGDPFYETLGMITLEDVIESIFQSEVIVDPPDIIRDNKHICIKGCEVSDFTRVGQRSNNKLSSQLESAVCQFLSKLPPFKDQLMSQQILGRLLKQDVVINIDLESDSASSHVLYERGRPSDCFTLVTEGRVRIHIGSEDFVFEGGPFMYFGVQALLGVIRTTPAGDVITQCDVVHGNSINSDPSQNSYIPDYTVEAVSDVQLVRITVTQYVAALRAAALEYHIQAEEASSGVDIFAMVGDGNMSPEIGFPADDSESTAIPKSRSQLLDHHRDADM